MYKIIGGDGREYGPVTLDQIRDWIAQGRATALTQVQAEGSPDWKPLGAYPELAALCVRPPSSPPGSMPRMPAVSKTNGFAVTGLVLGIVSLVGGACCYFGILTSPAGIIFSAIALNQMKKDPTQGGKGMAIAGLVTSIVAFLFSLAYLLFIGFALYFTEAPRPGLAQ